MKFFSRKYIKDERKKIKNSFKYAFNGISSSFKSERNMKIHTSIMMIVIILGFLFRINLLEWIFCLICFGLVISSELFNTSIETIIDIIMPKKNELAGRAKDIAAGAVLINALISFIIGLIIFIPKIISIIK